MVSFAESLGTLQIQLKHDWPYKEAIMKRV